MMRSNLKMSQIKWYLVYVKHYNYQEVLYLR